MLCHRDPCLTPVVHSQQTESSTADKDEPSARDVFAGFSYNGNAKPGLGGSLLDPPESPSRTGNPYGGSLSPPRGAGGMTTATSPARAEVGYGRSSRDGPGKGMPDLGLLSSDGHVSTVAGSPKRV
jgi:hypothetical protein